MLSKVDMTFSVAQVFTPKTVSVERWCCAKLVAYSMSPVIVTLQSTEYSGQCQCQSQFTDFFNVSFSKNDGLWLLWCLGHS